MLQLAPINIKRWAFYMKILRYLTFIFLLTPIFSEAADKSAASLIYNLQGVYKFRFMNSFVSGESYQSEDIVEIVPFEASQIYIRAHLQFANGHQCSIWGIAEYTNGIFVYHDPEKSSDGGPSCTLKISTNGKSLLLSDIDSATHLSTCSMYCGARGSLSNYAIATDSKRKIRYIEKLKASSQYLESVDAFNKTHHSGETR